MVEKLDADILVAALASSTGIHAILKAIERKMRVCLATKEILVSYGEIVMKAVRKARAKLIPIDSEHSAVYQCLEGRKMDDVARILLTSSGGPFFKKTVRHVKKSDVLDHPVWNMGKKITVDSATMMNKGLEIIEAHHLFGIPGEKIKVVVHPEAVCHSLVQFNDGSMLGQLSRPDMKLPIQYALTAPERLPPPIKPLDMDEVKQLRFFPPDFRKFPCLGLAYNALAMGKSMPAVLNGANEEAVRLFLADRLQFNEIPVMIGQAMRRHRPRAGGIDHYRQCERWARETVRGSSC
jgi:1-deoxy-D-xylulose-5-phosphate reductoisomerase